MTKRGKSAIKRTSQAFAGSKAYQNLLYVLRHSATVKEAGTRLGVSDRTIRRWKAYGIPEKSEHKVRRKLSNIARGFRQRESNIPPALRPEPKPLHYYRTIHGIRTKFIIVSGLPYDAILDIILRECQNHVYASFTYLLRLKTPFTGDWEGSWIKTAISEPWVSSRNQAIIPGYCHPEEFEEQLSYYFGLPNTEIYELRFRGWRNYDDQGNYIGPLDEE